MPPDSNATKGERRPVMATELLGDCESISDFGFRKCNASAHPVDHTTGLITLLHWITACQKTDACACSAERSSKDN